MSVSRAACHLMDVLLRLNIVPFSAVSETVQSMLLSIELSGPASLTETSSSLLNTIIQERIKENPTHFNTTAERILNWLLSKWTPSKRSFCRFATSPNSIKVFGLSEPIPHSMRTTVTPATCYVCYTLVWTGPTVYQNPQHSRYWALLRKPEHERLATTTSLNTSYFCLPRETLQP
jgi:hypothetical protein